MSATFTWTVRGCSYGGGKANATWTCGTCCNPIAMEAKTLPELFTRMQSVVDAHVAGHHGGRLVCGAPGYRANSHPCNYDRGHGGMHSWDS